MDAEGILTRHDAQRKYFKGLHGHAIAAVLSRGCRLEPLFDYIAVIHFTEPVLPVYGQFHSLLRLVHLKVHILVDGALL